jgi:hypothetical protein
VAVAVSSERRTVLSRAIIGALLLAAVALLAGSSGCSGSSCRSSKECAGDLYCAGPNDPPACGIPPRQLCATDADCSAGDVCHAIQDPCSPDGVGSECRPPCTAVSCGEGFRCNAAGACEPLPCDEGFSCPSHQKCDAAAAHGSGPVFDRAHGCVNISCSADSGCPSGKACVNGICQDGPGTCREAVAVP